MTRDEISVNAAIEIMAEMKQPHLGGDCQLMAKIQVIVNTALDRIARPDAACDTAKDDPRVDDLAMLVRRLVHALKKSSPDNGLSEKAVDYLRRNGLGGAVCRDIHHPTEEPAQ